MKSTEKLIYTNANNETVEFSYSSVYTPLKFSEDMSSKIITTKINLQDGETVIGESLDARAISIDGFFQLSVNGNYLERQLKKVLNPKLAGVLTFYALDSVRSIDVMPEGLPEITKETGRGIFSIDLIAHTPLWREQEKVEQLSVLTPLFHFPLVIPKNKGIVFAIRLSTLEAPIVNVGDVESGFRVVFEARGPVENPSIINVLTGERIKVLCAIGAGDTVEILNYPYKKQILINGIKSFGSLDRLNSSFFNLVVGDNLVGYQADVNTVNLDVTVYYYPLYL